MTDLTDRQLRWLHDELGAKPSDSDLQRSFDLLGSVRDVAVSVVRQRLSKIVNRPTTVAVSGVVSVGYADTIKALERQAARLEGLPADPSDDGDGDGDGGTVGDSLPALEIRTMRRRGRRR